MSSPRHDGDVKVTSVFELAMKYVPLYAIKSLQTTCRMAKMFYLCSYKGAMRGIFNHRLVRLSKQPGLPQI